MTQRVLFAFDGSPGAEYAQIISVKSDIVDGSRFSFSFKGCVSVQSKGLSEHLVKRDLVLPSEFLSMPPTTRENGLTGYYLTPLIGAYKITILPEHLNSWLVLPNTKISNIIPRPENDQYLRPWDEHDYKRLHHLEAIEAKPQGAAEGVIQEGNVLREIQRK